MSDDRQPGDGKQAFHLTLPDGAAHEVRAFVIPDANTYPPGTVCAWLDTNGSSGIEMPRYRCHQFEPYMDDDPPYRAWLLIMED